jgi:hypothetical protein
LAHHGKNLSELGVLASVHPKKRNRICSSIELMGDFIAISMSGKPILVAECWITVQDRPVCDQGIGLHFEHLFNKEH